MEQLVVGCVQMRMRLPQTMEELEANLLRFLRVAQAKRVRLLVFPQFTGLMTSAPMVRGTRGNLLKRADLARRGNVSFWERTRARLAGSAAGVLRADFGKALEQVLLTQPEALFESYTELFSRLARHHAVTIVAGSTYLVDQSDGSVRHLALVFGPDGELLGQQAAVSLASAEHVLVEPGSQWQVIPTPVGRLGILIGQDMLYPEAGRLLAYAGADVLVGLGASTYPVTYHRQRQGILARVEENQLYGLMSFMVGYNPFTPAEELPFVGRSLMAAPISMTPRFNSVLAEMGTDTAEGLITAEWSYPALYDLWVKDPLPLRSSMPIDTAGPALSALYARALTIDAATRIGERADERPGLPAPAGEVEAEAVWPVEGSVAEPPAAAGEMAGETADAQQIPSPAEVEEPQSVVEAPTAAESAPGVLEDRGQLDLPAVSPFPVDEWEGDETGVGDIAAARWSSLAGQDETPGEALQPEVDDQQGDSIEPEPPPKRRWPWSRA